MCGLYFQSLTHFFPWDAEATAKVPGLIFISGVMYCIIFEKLNILKVRTSVDILV